MRRILRWARRLIVWGVGTVVGVLVTGLVAIAVWMNLSPDRGPDVLLVTIDTQRIDGLACYGGTPGSTPNLDGLASRGVLFEQVVASIPRTTQNVSTLLTGLEPKEHGVRELYDRLPHDVVTLAERLQALGYRTAAFVGGGPLGEGQNLYQGFDDVHVHAFEDQARAASEVLAASSWITRHAPGPWFVWVHVYDPHFYYAPPWPFWSRGDPEHPAVAELYRTLGERRGSFGDLHYRTELPPERHRYLVDLYRGETRSVDFAFGWLFRLVGLYERLDPGRRTLIVMTADHGEGLGEHGCRYNHGVYLYDEDLLVPLVISLPGTLPEGQRVSYQVRTFDIYPTVLDLLGHSPPGDLSGSSLLPLVRGEEKADRIAFVEGDTNRHPQNPRFHFEDGLVGRWRAVRDGSYKLIRVPNPDGDIYELFDLRADPAESRNLVADDADNRRRLQELLSAWEARPGARAAAERELPEDELDDRLDRLRTLGYVD